jgi:Cu/Ag efflux pump CusA
MGGLISSTLLTLLVLPALYVLVHRRAVATSPDPLVS